MAWLSQERLAAAVGLEIVRNTPLHFAWRGHGLQVSDVGPQMAGWRYPGCQTHGPGAQCALGHHEATCLLIPVILAFALMFPDLDAPPKYKAWIQDHEVWMETSAGPRRVIYDALAADPVAASPAGDRVVYGVINPDFDPPHCGNTPQKFVVLVNASGQFQWKTALKDACNDFTKFEWIDDHRIGVMLCGHANCFYWVLDAGSGAILEEDSGGFDFVWSHNRRYVAHRTV